MLLTITTNNILYIILYSFVHLLLQVSTTLCCIHVVDKPTVSVVTPEPVVEGQSVTITCRTLGARPAVTSVTWKKGQEVITVTSDSKYSGGTVQTPSLTIGSVLKTDAGEYTCRLGNDVGQGTGSVTLEVWCK